MGSSDVVAAIQMTSTADRARNLATALRLVNEAADQGARLIGLPENFAFMGPDADRCAGAEPVEGPTIAALQEVARRRGVHVLAGSIAEKVADPGKTSNTSVLIASDGAIAATYRKIHLFDATLPGGERYAESATVVAGDRTSVALADTPLGRVGLSICYDLRFPELYRGLSILGAEILCVPAAFTVTTGRDHWEVLLRARAIENQCWAMAPAQVGQNAPGRETYGDAMLVDPWGTVLARCSGGEGVCLARFDRSRLEQVRAALPALRHRRI